MKHPFLFQIVKMADIGFITILYASIALLLAKIMDIFDKPLEKTVESKKNTLQIFVEFLLFIFLVGVVSYIAQLVVNNIPSPFEGQYGLHHSRLKELGNVGIFIFIFLYFQDHLKEKMQFLFDRLG
jgi:membrane protease YdiL (CAAX protease family)